MDSSLLTFFMEYRIEGVHWRVECTAQTFDVGDQDNDVDVDLVKVTCASCTGVRLDEDSWKALLKEHGLVTEFCEQMLSTLAMMQWSLNGPAGEA